MDPNLLLPPASPIDYPAPYWFMLALKVLGFSLHMGPMNIWYVGAPLAAFFSVFGRGNARIVGFHIARSLPFMLAFGINFGIVPLLFTQVAYHQFFYPATILMAWPWFSVFWLVMIAYFSVYLYRLAVRGGVAAEVASVGKQENKEYTPSRLLDFTGHLGIWVAAGAFTIVGFFFANAFSLMTNVGGWFDIFRDSNSSSAATGLALNINDPTLIPRWLFMIGIAITTTAAFIAVDGVFLSGRESEDYRRYSGRFAFGMYTIGILAFAGFGSWYIFGAISGIAEEMLQHSVMRILFPLTAISPGLPWLLLLLQRNNPSRRIAAFVGFAQFGVIALNAVSRQWVQNRELAPLADLANRPVDLQLGGIILFLVLFAGGLALVGWMAVKIVDANRREASES